MFRPRYLPRHRTRIRAGLLLLSTVLLVLAGRFHTPHGAGAEQHCQVCALAAVAKGAAPAAGVPTLSPGRIIILETADQPSAITNPPPVQDRARSPPVLR